MQDKNIKKLWYVNKRCFIEEFAILQTKTSDGKIEHTYFERTKTGELKSFPTCQIKEINCTGLKDKNDKLIYEGDIIEVQYLGGQISLFGNKYSNAPKPERFKIIYDENWHKYRCEYIDRMSTIEIHSLDIDKLVINNDNKIFEIIGNIYENPELLEEKNAG